LNKSVVQILLSHHIKIINHSIGDVGHVVRESDFENYSESSATIKRIREHVNTLSAVESIKLNSAIELIESLVKDQTEEH
jgi:hypothetical protein